MFCALRFTIEFSAIPAAVMFSQSPYVGDLSDVDVENRARLMQQLKAEVRSLVACVVHSCDV